MTEEEEKNISEKVIAVLKDELKECDSPFLLAIIHKQIALLEEVIRNQRKKK